MRGDNMISKHQARINHIQKGLKADPLRHKRPLSEFAELVNLISNQFDDDTNLIEKEIIPCHITLN